MGKRTFSYERKQEVLGRRRKGYKINKKRNKTDGYTTQSYRPSVHYWICTNSWSIWTHLSVCNSVTSHVYLSPGISAGEPPDYCAWVLVSSNLTLRSGTENILTAIWRVLNVLLATGECQNTRIAERCLCLMLKALKHTDSFLLQSYSNFIPCTNP